MAPRCSSGCVRSQSRARGVVPSARRSAPLRNHRRSRYGRCHTGQSPAQSSVHERAGAPAAPRRGPGREVDDVALERVRLAFQGLGLEQLVHRQRELSVDRAQAAAAVAGPVTLHLAAHDEPLRHALQDHVDHERIRLGDARDPGREPRDGGLESLDRAARPGDGEIGDVRCRVRSWWCVREAAVRTRGRRAGVTPGRTAVQPGQRPFGAGRW